MKLLGRLVRTLLGGPFLFLYMCAMASLIILSGESQFSEACLVHWTRMVLRVVGIRVLFRPAKLDPNRSYVFVCNHTSHTDAPTIIATVGRPLRFIAKKELSYIPFFGQAASRMGNVFINRKNSRAAADAIERRLARGFTQGVGLFFFAEGTRATEDELLPFKKGAAIAALETQLDVVPMAIAGARAVLPPKGFALFNPGPVVLVMGEPIPVSQFTYETREAFTQAQRAAVEKQLAEAKALLASAKA